MALQAYGSDDVRDLLVLASQAHSRALEAVANQYKDKVARLEAEVKQLRERLQETQGVDSGSIHLKLEEGAEAIIASERANSTLDIAGTNTELLTSSAVSNGTTQAKTSTSSAIVAPANHGNAVSETSDYFKRNDASLVDRTSTHEEEGKYSIISDDMPKSPKAKWRVVGSARSAARKVQMNEENSVVDIDCVVDKVSRAHPTFRSSGSPLSVSTAAAMNKNLHLRTQWTVHPEQENTDLMLLQAGSGFMEETHSGSGEDCRKVVSTQPHDLDTISKCLCGRFNPGVQSYSDLIAPPGANWRLCWDLFGAILIGYDTVMIPFTLSFEPKENAFVVLMNWWTMLFWSLDMVFTFFVGFIHNGQTVMDPRRIAQRYFMTWFFLDLLVVASDWFNNVGEASSSKDGSGSNVGGLGKLVRSLRVIRVLRLLRLLKLKRMMADFQDHISSEYTYLLLSLVKLLFFILFLNHGIACLWFWIGRHEYENDNPSWIAANNMKDQELGYQYTTSLHWTLTQFTPASMEVFPQNTAERTMSVIVLMFALVAFSSFVGSISTSMTALRNMNASINKQFWMLRRFLKQQSIPKQVSRRIVKYLEYIVEKKHGKVQQANITIIQMLSDQLREELTFELTFPSVQSQLFFTYLINYPLMDVVMRKICNLALRNKLIACDDHVFYPGDEATHVYCFLGPGIMDYQYDDGTAIYPPVKEGEWIAEIGLWSAWKHVGRFKALTESEFLCVDIQQFAKECCKTVSSWRLASQYGEAYLNLLRGEVVDDIIRNDRITNLMKDWIEEDKKEHFVVSPKEAAVWKTPGLRSIRRTVESSLASPGSRSQDVVDYVLSKASKSSK